MFLRPAFILLVLHFRSISAQSENTTSPNVENRIQNPPAPVPFPPNTFLWEAGLSPNPCPTPLKVSSCKDLVTPENIAKIRGGWVPYGNPCSPSLHRAVWTQFWLDRLVNETITRLLDYKDEKTQACSEFVYQTCDGASSTCTCGLGAVYSEGTCKLVEGAFVDVSCGDTLIPNQILGETKHELIEDPRSCLLDFKIECAGSAACHCFQKTKVEKGVVSYSLCNPKVGGQEQWSNTILLGKATVEKAKSLPWLQHGAKCLIYENFSSRISTHIQNKLEIINWLENYIMRGKFGKICNPFDNLECDGATKLCSCSRGFIRQDNECRLTAASKNGVQKSIEPINPYARETCEWEPEFNFLLAHVHDEHDHDVVDGKDSAIHFPTAIDLITVPCVDGAVCQPSADNAKVKVCTCQAGMVCHDEEVASGSLQQNVPSISLIFIVAAFLWRVC